MFFLDRQIVMDHQYGRPGYRFVKSNTIHTFKHGDKDSEKRALMRANNDKKYYEHNQAKSQRYIPLQVIKRSLYGSD